MSRQLPLRRILLLVMAAGLTGCLAFGAAYCARPGTAWYFTAAVASGMFAYHMFIRFLSPAVLWLFFRKRYDYRSCASDGCRRRDRQPQTVEIHHRNRNIG